MKVYRKVFRGKEKGRTFWKYRYLKEKSFYSQANELDLNLLEVKKFKNDSIVFEKVEERKESLSKGHKEQVVSDLVRMQVSGRPSFRIKIFLLDKLIDSLPARYFRGAIIGIRKTLGFWAMLKTVKIYFKASKKNDKFNTSLTLHNDFRIKNLIITEDEVYIIDFESVTETKKWILLDIIKYCFHVRTFKFKTRFFETYLQEVRNHVEIDKIDLPTHIRVIILKLYADRFTKADNPRKPEVDFVEKVLLDDKAFKKWYNECVSI